MLPFARSLPRISYGHQGRGHIKKRGSRARDGRSCPRRCGASLQASPCVRHSRNQTFINHAGRLTEAARFRFPPLLSCACCHGELARAARWVPRTSLLPNPSTEIFENLRESVPSPGSGVHCGFSGSRDFGFSALRPSPPRPKTMQYCGSLSPRTWISSTFMWCNADGIAPHSFQVSVAVPSTMRPWRGGTEEWKDAPTPADAARCRGRSGSGGSARTPVPFQRKSRA